jgi:glycosyltransferase involved in cell wall biosynthesis
MVIWSDPAKADVRAIHDFIAHDSKFYARTVLQDIMEVFFCRDPHHSLARHPETAAPLWRQCAAAPDLQLIIIGRAPVAALKHGQDERARNDAAAARQGPRDAVRFLGGLSDDEVVGAMLVSQALVFPVRGLPGDSEGFGMVAVESAAQGSPTVAFRVGEVGAAVADAVSGDLLEPADYPTLQRARLHRPSDSPDAQVRASCQQFAARFVWPELDAGLSAWARAVALR